MRVDWKTYYREFARAHGGNPVLYGENEQGRGGWLLFSDGWRYGRSPEGPEYPPETDDRQLQLIKAYWTTRERTLRQKAAELKARIEELVRIQQRRSVPIQVPIRYKRDDGDGNKVLVRETVPVDFQGMLDDWRATLDEADLCLRKLEEMERPERVIVRGFNPAAILTELEDR